ncbi:YihY/virulence factor BrkB family protein [Pseudonocardia charpentierae]|uniref:YihY/virulence factor BrkB family protein n=1 Tax=Pseudonocardia charpentierae TaxID=3075545 RepID=A0ABU2N5Y9_9PSEU|nr:YihY/virulence factor BrkB family protein [Pseudonocardia sp. DSM 45834]MDT0349357.1 YihY/virulence factor BrkB family protein [Pseudonocardia sp. DSM 45834]
MPGSKALAWAVVGLAALRKRKDQSAVHKASVDPFRPRPPRAHGPGTNGQVATSEPGVHAAPASNSAGSDSASDTPASNGAPSDAVQRPGEQAELPTQIPAKGWWQVTRRAFKESSADNVGILAGGIAYAAFLAIFPALIAGISLFGLVADPATIGQQAEGVLAALPETAQPLLRDQIVSLTQTSGGALSFSLAISILLALWSASSGTSSLMTAINIAYDEQESRNFLKLRGTALLLTLGAIVFVLLTLALVAVVPAVLNALQLGTFINLIVQIVRWVLLIVLIIAALAVVYRMAPDRDAPQFKWTSVGALVAGVLWVLASLGFSLYVNNFGSYNKTYGALAGVVVLLLWLYLTSYIILLGAEINAESEKQTKQDTTTGPPLPMGERRAEAADTVADPPEPAKKK